MIRYVLMALVLLLLAFTPLSCQREQFRVGAKKFTESVILGEIITHLARGTGLEVPRVQELGGTRLLFSALCQGDIDVYAEYTGTIREEILAGQDVQDAAHMRQILHGQGIGMTEPLGFNNTYALAMKKDVAGQHSIRRISDLTRHPDLTLGFGHEFVDRQDGWRNLRKHYGLSQSEVKGMDHDLAYRQLDVGAVDVIDAYTTDAKVKQYDLLLLEDDRDYFPRYSAIFLFRLELEHSAPRLVEALRQLSGRIDDQTMAGLNARVELSRVAENRVAAEFLQDAFGLDVDVQQETAGARILRHTVEHLDLVRQSLLPAVLCAVPLGVLAAKQRGLGQGVLAVVGVIQTIPSLALLVILMPLIHWLGLSSIGQGSITAVVALFLYSLLPIVRNTFTGLHDISPQIHESAKALGLPALARLRLVELPLASRTILAGIKTAAVLNVGFATLGALIGAGGYGQPILRGIRLNDTSLILQGAIPAAVLAIATQGLFELAERFWVPKGLRLAARSIKT